MGLTPELLRLFLDLFSAHNPVELNTTFSETKILFTACEKFDCHDKVMGPIRDILYSQGEQQLWELLTWAAERDDRKMGAWALGRMSAVIFLQGRNQFGFFVGLKRSLETLPYSWRSEILYIALEIDHPAQAVVDRKDLYTWRSRSKNVYTGTRIRQKEERVCPFREDWSQVASAFEAGPPH
ncbi:uncharacterized protein I303_100802 [Kwoniella dejecticola CBS 10117]|uniref:Uncharacterized protein n=1 Tax=Kwoniella dejecticola CBS 10117 TaxID=1296121 RepID=A0A1A6AG01_9TREE|nr:uncharacterized protein I303_00804 [Kwoniella dejecticola CBS 10117]OBR88984.1 hypothetical protein I303_00804 [Kwoniella dejecticola CBS 10117]